MNLKLEYFDTVMKLIRWKSRTSIPTGLIPLSPGGRLSGLGLGSVAPVNNALVAVQMPSSSSYVSEELINDRYFHAFQLAGRLCNCNLSWNGTL